MCRLVNPPRNAFFDRIFVASSSKGAMLPLS
jgi:hypothetical protein